MDLNWQGTGGFLCTCDPSAKSYQSWTVTTELSRWLGVASSHGLCRVITSLSVFPDMDMDCCMHAGKWELGKKHNPWKVWKCRIQSRMTLLLPRSYPQTALGSSLQFLLMPVRPPRISHVSSDGFKALWNCNPNIDKDRKSTPFIIGKKARTVGLQDAPAKEEFHSTHEDENRPPFGSAWSRTSWDDVFIRYTKGFLSSIGLYLKFKDKIISLLTWSCRSSRICFLCLKH